MTKILLFWTLGVITVSLLLGGGAWFVFYIFDKAKKRNLF